MIRARALPWRGAVVAAGIAAAVVGPDATLAYAGAVIFLLGLPHGAGDLLLVRRADRAAFVTTYLLAGAAVLLLWRLPPEGALCGFLLLSAAHFAGDAAPGERALCAALPLAGPALLHAPELAGIFEGVGVAAGFANGLARTMWVVGAGAAIGLVVALARAEARASATRLALGGGAAILLPPVAGFAAAFVILHAGPETARRAREAGGTVAGYLARVAPAMAGAAGVTLVAAWLARDRPAPDLAALFGAISALAAPHMLVTPFWAAHGKGARSRLRAQWKNPIPSP